MIHLIGRSAFIAVIAGYLQLHLCLSNVLAQEFRQPNLAGIVSNDPSRVVRIEVDLQRIHRGLDVEQLLDGFELRVTEIGFKHVGSGAGGLGVPPYESFSAYFLAAERNYVARLVKLAGIDAENLPPCEIDDDIAPVVDTHGIPASKLREAACGLRIHKLELTGSAVSALDFMTSIDPSVVVVRLKPSDYDMMRLSWHMLPDIRSDEMLEQIRERFPEFDAKDFPE